jgi:uncharacterized membrane protein required for colicin V production
VKFLDIPYSICYILITFITMEITARAALIDLFFLILCLRIIYISVSKGALQEFFKALGLLLSALFAFHFYSFLGKSINDKIAFLSKEYLYFFSFLAIFLGIGAIFNLLRLIAALLFKQEVVPRPQRWAGFFIGVFRASFLSSIIFFLLYLSPLNSQYFNDTVSYKVFKQIAPKIYLLSFKIYNKFDKQAEINKEVEVYYEVKRSLPGNSQEGN